MQYCFYRCSISDPFSQFYSILSVVQKGQETSRIFVKNKVVLQERILKFCSQYNLGLQKVKTPNKLLNTFVTKKHKDSPVEFSTTSYPGYLPPQRNKKSVHVSWHKNTKISWYLTSETLLCQHFCANTLDRKFYDAKAQDCGEFSCRVRRQDKPRISCYFTSGRYSCRHTQPQRVHWQDEIPFSCARARQTKNKLLFYQWLVFVLKHWTSESSLA